MAHLIDEGKNARKHECAAYDHGRIPRRAALCERAQQIGIDLRVCWSVDHHQLFSIKISNNQPRDAATN
jgi:hypothetical protein